MPLSAYSKKFSEVNDELNRLVEAGELTTADEVRAFVSEKGLDPVSYTHLTLPTIYSV